MDIADMPRLNVERTIQEGKHPDPEDIAGLLCNGDITPIIGQYIADHYVIKTKQRLVGSKQDRRTKTEKRAFAAWLVNEEIEDARKLGKTITKTEAIARAAKYGIKGFSRSALEHLLKEP